MGAILGKKIGMTRLYNDKREAISCTIIQAGPCFVTQVKHAEKDGYDAYQIGIGERDEKKVNKPMLGHYKKAGVTPGYKIAEFSKSEINLELEAGAPLDLSVFKEGEKINVLGVSKGKGFAGVVKRHNFGGGSRTHGQSDRLRAPGSVGGSSDPSRTFRGTRMAGRMGGCNITVKNLEIIRIMPESNLLVVKGAIPGPKNSYVKIVSTKK
ncbi:MAG: 50S ribosomal protein L3 [Chlorobiaceae bacterium]|jgi:large subunit ribosomal protein L3|uniref:Large ribosomal subunit protein uL3 n=1 Tax=Chlorobium phaeobacteroides (strain DSM 266 / SMG 266 / 2430) TaxID=290317 RepID=RL3_CHLPD|nr:50S ribosomal protein L3 [Chlorobium phaeobacteroides]A1BJ34.1 RecName: Full=Large ribosomal subunit protein uL3; AltName: Full=50S ribosomal protein L3 [Chlorobium phaeobacteroides DSM 266]NTV93310.1 50S ribosomal protein L3 [Chlorobiaceae bacterium]ABL66411.1 LSU ribosomal protein L3P [Chlorobium phaeobacteroides DSM 266]MBV5319562.1 50S ribosomal protein L3 [Chlorobium phaeobacteroides]NTW63644.1 50S ribosomal protein L3 [Chlorobiaceae bacterium]